MCPSCTEPTDLPGFDVPPWRYLWAFQSASCGGLASRVGGHSWLTFSMLLTETPATWDLCIPTAGLGWVQLEQSVQTIRQPFTEILGSESRSLCPNQLVTFLDHSWEAAGFRWEGRPSKPPSYRCCERVCDSLSKRRDGYLLAGCQLVIV